MILREFKISLTTYFASATVIGLAVGFGLQGFVQDLVIGLTLIFSNALNIGEVVKLGDEIGRVDTIGLRFTTLINLHGQRILLPNRNITVISQFRGNCIRAYIDIQLPQGIDEQEISQAVMSIAKGMHNQHKSIILAVPELFGIKDVKEGQWRYLRVKIKLWPGQTKLIEETFKERVIQVLKKHHADIDTIKSRGIDAILNLCAECYDLHDIETAAGLEVHWLSIADENAPELDTAQKALVWMDSILVQGKKVLVHCRFGIGRTGTLMVAWLLKQGHTMDDALEMLSHTPAEPKSRRQWDFLNAYSLSVGKPAIPKPVAHKKNRARLGKFFRKHFLMQHWGDD